MTKKDWLKLLPTNYNGHNLRKLALENYDEKFCRESAKDAADALCKSFNWNSTEHKGQGYNFWEKICVNIRNGTIKLSKPKAAKPKQTGSESKLKQIDQTSVLKAAIEKFGREPQMRMVQEECAELIQAVSKYIRSKESGFNNLCEEIADVEIMLAQLRLILDKDKYIDSIKDLKLKRLQSKL